jgi:hypothetical protein
MILMLAQLCACRGSWEGPVVCFWVGLDVGMDLWTGFY